MQKLVRVQVCPRERGSGKRREAEEESRDEADERDRYGVGLRVMV